MEAYDALQRTEDQLQKEHIIQKMKIQIPSLAEIQRYRDDYDVDI